MSYCTLQEAQEYIETHFTTTDSLRCKWGNLSDIDKQILLEQAHDIIDSLPLVGCKTRIGQPNAFPRCPMTEVPQEVKYAEIEQAVSMSDVEARQAFDEYRKAVQYGIQSYSIGNFKETLLSYGKHSIEVTFGLSSDTAKRFLTPFMSGGYRIG